MSFLSFLLPLLRMERNPIRRLRPIMPDHNCVATTFLLPTIRNVGGGLSSWPRPRPSFCFRGVSAAGYRSGSWNLILSSRFRERRQEAEGRWRNVVAVKHAKNTDRDDSRTQDKKGEWRHVAQHRCYHRFLNYSCGCSFVT